jgi:Rod binding domain-containing protein
MTPIGPVGFVPAPAPAAGASVPAASAAVPVAGSDQAKIDEAAKKFEGIFVSYLVEEMMKSTGMSESQPIYSGLATEKLGDQLASTGSFGLAALISGQLGGITDSAAAPATGPNDGKEQA